MSGQLLHGALNPAAYIADPMVLLTDRGYFAYGTGHSQKRQTRSQFPVLHSPDFLHWSFEGEALEVPVGMEGLSYWAPEVAEKQGTYCLYYSAGGPEGEGHKLRVATSMQPHGPFRGTDEPLIPDEPFTIDAHPFLDPISGKGYLFFAKDFFEEPTGTGIAVVDLSEDLMTVTGPTTPLLRGQADWQIFERQRFWYERVWPTWYCVEGPFVVYRNSRYWMFYSGGNWHADQYGIGCAVADSVTGPYVDHRANRGPSILKTGKGLYGPGHCSITIAPDGRDAICFHAWDENYSARTMHIALLEWSKSGPAVGDLLF